MCIKIQEFVVLWNGERVQFYRRRETVQAKDMHRNAWKNTNKNQVYRHPH